MSVTTRVLDFAHAPHRMSASVRADAERLLADTLMVGAAGATAPGAAGVLDAARRWGAGEDARCVGDGARLPVAGAAFVNGFRIHCLEWDAVHEPAVVHAMSVVTAAVGAAIDRRGGCDANEALAALAVGVEVASGLGEAATSPLSFFRPAVAGCIGAALAVARIERLARPAFDDVLGLAYSQCAGTMQAHIEGSIALPLQIAHAARAAVCAVDLAAAGLTGPHDAIEGAFGYFRLFDRGDAADIVASIGERWRIAGVSTKPFPSGRASHGVLGVLASLSADQRGAVERIEARVPPLVARLVARPMRAEMTPAYARLCLPFLTALMLADGRIDPRRFTGDAFGDAALAARAGCLTVTIDDRGDPNALSPQRVTIHLRGGDVEAHEVPTAPGSPDAPLSKEMATAKRELARALSPEADARIFDAPLSCFTEPR
jgi:2-methylcitrate dehydratase PrpD